MSHAKRDPKSPYARYNKRPFAYSDQYHNWREATTESDRLRWAAAHAKAFLGFDPTDYPTGRYPGVTKGDLK